MKLNGPGYRAALVRSARGFQLLDRDDKRQKSYNSSEDGLPRLPCRPTSYPTRLEMSYHNLIHIPDPAWTAYNGLVIGSLIFLGSEFEMAWYLNAALGR